MLSRSLNDAVGKNDEEVVSQSTLIETPSTVTPSSVTSTSKSNKSEQATRAGHAGSA
jgi:hypothetical protein